jgi:hypothetical protein
VKRRRQLLSALLLGALQVLLPPVARSHGLLPRRLVLERSQPGRLTLSYDLDPVEALQALLEPSWPRERFIAHVSGLAPTDFERALQRARAALMAQTRLSTPAATTLPLKAWEWPPATAWQEPVQVAAFLQQAGAPVPDHPRMVQIRAHAEVPSPRMRLTLHVPLTLLPLQVLNGPSDAFWLTAMVPTGIVDV